ncbi:hypothetical protein [uncultured Methylibium sp.]|uniref:hypothetical protein n=1 Tax=uncultured Methylibium sp. TaxID=381093 RepID=UPI0025E21FC7|nr:hypothetical protein [uncultured Methylibium sp.]
MTWYADEILITGTARALKWAAASALADSSYVVRELAENSWDRPDQEHGLPSEGLLVVRPVCGKSSYGAKWHDSAFVDWSTLIGTEVQVSSNRDVDQVIAEYLDEESTPPLPFRAFLSQLSHSLEQSVVYYACAMWGGDIDYEYSLIYSPNELIATTRPTLPPERPGEGDALQVGLLALGLRLPTPFFALHTRSFPWGEHRLRSEA